jgi:hypothetical protein
VVQIVAMIFGVLSCKVHLVCSLHGMPGPSQPAPCHETSFPLEHPGPHPPNCVQAHATCAPLLSGGPYVAQLAYVVTIVRWPGAGRANSLTLAKQAASSLTGKAAGEVASDL